jgi:hypothetical protein
MPQRALLIISAFIAFGACVEAALLPAAERGLAYILSCQRRDGLWSENASLPDGLAAITALWAMNEPAAASARLLGQSALLLKEELPTDELPAALLSYICGAALEPSLLQPFFVAGDGACCLLQGAQADVLSTLLVVEALLLAPTPEIMLLAASHGYLLAQRQEDGLWRLCSQSSPGDLRLSARVIDALARIKNVAQINSESDSCGYSLAALPDDLSSCLMTSARTLAASLATASGVSSLLDAAWVLRALCSLACWQEAQALCALLQSLQQRDGSWGEGTKSEVLQASCAVLTALRCLAIRSAERAPDLALPTASLRLYHDVEDTAGHLTAMVYNEGLAESLPCTWELHSGIPGIDTLLAQGRLPHLLPRGSCKIQAEFVLRDELTMLYLIVDPAGESGDGQRSNNMARLIYRPNSEGNDCSLWLSPLTIASEGKPELLLLRPGWGALISAMLLTEGQPASAGLQLVLTDNGEECQRQELTLPLSGLKECRCEWFPGAGWHDVMLQIRLGEQILAERSLGVEVSYDDPLLRIVPGAHGELAGQPQFAAAEYVGIRLYSVSSEDNIDLWVSDANGQRLDIPVLRAAQEGRYTWHSGVCPPGRYHLHAQKHGSSERCVRDFIIIASCELRETSVLEPDFMAHYGVGDTLETSVLIRWAQVCNSQRPLTLSWAWIGPDATLLAAAPEPYEFDTLPGAMTQELALPESVRLPFPLAGSYLFQVLLSDGETFLIASRSARAQLLPSLMFEQTLHPECLGWEAGTVTVATRVCLQRGAGSNSGTGGIHIPEQGLPAALLDDPGSELELVLSGIHDDAGQRIAQGSLLVRTLYGSCQGGARLSTLPYAGIFAIVDGVCRIAYVPGATTLSAGMSAPAMIALHDPQTEELLANLELQLGGGHANKQ